MSPDRSLAALVLTFLLLAPSSAPAQTTPAPALPIGDGDVVHLEYTLTDEGGTPIESNKGKDPLIYTQGRGEIIRGLEKALLGMRQGETKHVTVSPEDGYGLPDPGAVVELPRAQVPPDVQAGAQLVGRNQNGQSLRARVKEVRETTVVLYFNHPMAGKTLIFDIKVLSVTPAKAN